MESFAISYKQCEPRSCAWRLGVLANSRPENFSAGCVTVLYRNLTLYFTGSSCYSTGFPVHRVSGTETTGCFVFDVSRQYIIEFYLTFIIKRHDGLSIVLRLPSRALPPHDRCNVAINQKSPFVYHAGPCTHKHPRAIHLT